MYSILEGDANTNNMADLLVKQTAKAACPVIPYLIFRKLWRIVCWECGIFVIKDIIEWSWWNLRTEYFSICQQDWLPSKCFTEWKIIHIAQDFIFSPERCPIRIWIWSSSYTGVIVPGGKSNLCMRDETCCNTTCHLVQTGGVPNPRYFFTTIYQSGWFLCLRALYKQLLCFSIIE